MNTLSYWVLDMVHMYKTQTSKPLIEILTSPEYKPLLPLEVALLLSVLNHVSMLILFVFVLIDFARLFVYRVRVSAKRWILYTLASILYGSYKCIEPLTEVLMIVSLVVNVLVIVMCRQDRRF